MAVIVVTDKNYQAEVAESDKPVLLDFWAEWCGPCQQMAPVVEEIAEEYGSIKVGKVNVDEEMELAQKFHVVYIPTLVLVKNGEAAATHVGYSGKQELLNELGITG